MGFKMEHITLIRAFFRNKKCALLDDLKLTCNKTKCESTGRGKCVGEKCLCHRGWASSNDEDFDPKLGRFITSDVCDKECPDLGDGIL